MTRELTVLALSDDADKVTLRVGGAQDSFGDFQDVFATVIDSFSIDIDAQVTTA